MVSLKKETGLSTAQLNRNSNWPADWWSLPKKMLKFSQYYKCTCLHLAFGQLQQIFYFFFSQKDFSAQMLIYFFATSVFIAFAGRRFADGLWNTSQITCVSEKFSSIVDNTIKWTGSGRERWMDSGRECCRIAADVEGYLRPVAQITPRKLFQLLEIWVWKRVDAPYGLKGTADVSVRWMRYIRSWEIHSGFGVQHETSSFLKMNRMHF